MKKNHDLIKNTFIIFIGKACTQFVSLFLLPLYTSVLAKSEYGVVDLITTYVTLLVPLITLQLETSTFRFLIDARSSQQEKTNIITNSLFLCLFLTFIVTILSVFVNCFIKIHYFIYIVFMIFVTILSNFVLQVARGKGNVVNYSIGCTITGIMTIILNLLFLLYFKLGIIGMFLAQIISNFICFIFIFIKEKLWNFININNMSKYTCFELLRYSLPLVPNGLIWWIINASDRTIITMIIGASANGIYAVSNKFSMIIIQAYNVFNLSWTESATIHINDEDRDEFFSNTFWNVLKIFSSLCIFMIAFIPLLFKIMVNNNFVEAYYYIPFLILGTIFNIVVSFIGCIYVAKKRTKQIAATSFWSGILNIAINLLFIKYIGIYAAAMSTIAAFAIMSIYRYIDVQKYVKLNINIKNLFIIFLGFSVSICLYYKNNIYLNIVNIFFVIGYTICLNKNIILCLLRKILKKYN